MRLPKILEDWLFDSEMDASRMTKDELVGEASLCLYACTHEGFETFREMNYHPNSIAALRRWLARN